MKFFDRLLTIVVTATITSLAWIVFGGTLLEMAQDRDETEDTETESPADQGEPVTQADTAPVASADQPADRRDNRGLLIPVEGVSASQLTDNFLDPRGEDGTDRHEAIDIAAPRGTAVVAAMEGTIAKLHASPAGGNAIYLRTPDRRHIHYYAHLDSYAPGLSEGQRVRAGQLLGKVGSTGNASEDAPHLHFAILQTTADAEWWEPANAVNPYPLLKRQPD